MVSTRFDGIWGVLKGTWGVLATIHDVRYSPLRISLYIYVYTHICIGILYSYRCVYTHIFIYLYVYLCTMPCGSFLHLTASSVHNTHSAPPKCSGPRSDSLLKELGTLVLIAAYESRVC